MAFTLPELPYETTALEPYLSAETFEYHYGKHHKTYIDTLNGMIEGTDEEKSSLEDIILSSEGKKFNQAAQVWNHTLYWNSMAPGGGGAPSGAAGDAINEAFGSYRQVPRRVQDRGDRSVRLRLGVADARRRQARHLGHQQRRPADEARPDRRADVRRVGARLLHRLPQRPPELRRRLPRQPDQLEAPRQRLELTYGELVVSGSFG